MVAMDFGFGKEYWTSKEQAEKLATMKPVAVDAALAVDLGWIGVDLDGTLATYEGWVGPGTIGAPIPEMVVRVRDMLGRGYNVKIMTARCTDPDPRDRAVALKAIRLWCEKHLGRPLEVTATKDLHMIELWDDRAVQVMHNEGVPVPGQLSRVYGILGGAEDGSDVI